MSAITVEEFVNKVSYKVDMESLKQVLRVTDKLYTHLGKALTGVSTRMDASWRNSMANMAKASHESARSIAEDGRKASAAWRTRTPGTTAPGAEKGGAGAGMGLLAMAGRLGAGYAAYSVGKFAVKSAADLERMTAQFEVMLGSADKAKAMIGDIQKLAASTPLETMGIADTARTLMAMGVSSDKVVDVVRQIGDVAGGNQEVLQGMAMAYGQVVSKGVFQGEEAMQLAERGFNVVGIISQNLEKFGLKAGTTTQDILKMQKQGKLTPEMMAKAFEIATSAGGKYYKNMEMGAKTLGGLWSTLTDNVTMGLVKAVEPFLPMLKEFVDWLSGIDWTPVISMASMLADGLRLFIRTLKNEGVLESLELIKVAIMDMFGSGGAINWATVVRAAAHMVADAYWLIANAVAIVSGWIQVLQNNLILLAPFALSIGSKMAFSMLAALGPIGAVVAALGVVYYAYQRINEAREQGAREEKYHAAMVEEAGAARSHAVLSAEKAKYAHYAATGRWTGSPTEAIPTRAAAAEIANRLGASVNEAKAKRDAASARMQEATGADNSGQSAAGSFSALLQQQLNSLKKVTITQNNNIQMPVTVDDKGNTQLTPGAVDSLVDVKLRSVLNVKFLGVLAQGI